MAGLDTGIKRSAQKNSIHSKVYAVRWLMKIALQIVEIISVKFHVV